MTRDEIQTVYDAGPEAVSAWVTGLRQGLDEVTARGTEVERQVQRNWRNSSQPPAQDGFQKQTKSLRPKSERRVGGQPGHRGAPLRLREHPDQIATHTVTPCAGCGQDLHEIGILPLMHGIAVPDAWAPYWHAECEHGWCKVPHWRALTALVAPGDQAWAQEMKDLLCDLKRRVEQAPAAGAEGLDAATHEAFVTPYQALLTQREDWHTTPPPRPSPGSAGTANKAKPATCSCACHNARPKSCA